MNKIEMDNALINASSNGHKEIVEMFLQDEKIEINQQDDYGGTALINGHLYSRSYRNR
jgi:hypothetical protein